MLPVPRRGLGPLLLFCFFLVACSGDGPDPKESVEGASATSTPPIPAATDVPSVTVNVLSYNVLYGAGVFREFDGRLPQGDRPIYGGRNRLPDVVDILRSHDADVIGIQEANGWDRGNPSVAEDVAVQLGMDFFLARGVDRGFHLVLLSRYEILEAEDISPQLGINGGIRARLRLPDGQDLHVFVVHFTPDAHDLVACQIKTLQQLAQPFYSERVVLMGDVNQIVRTPAVQQLVKGGWTNIADAGIDQVWVGPIAGAAVSGVEVDVAAPRGVSDHPPVAARVTFRQLPPEMTRVNVQASSEACDNPGAGLERLILGPEDRIDIPAIGLSAPLTVRALTSGAFPEPARDGVTVYDTAILPGHGGRPGSGNVILAAPSCCAFSNVGALRPGMEISIRHHDRIYGYKAVVVCRAPRDEFIRLKFETTDRPTLTLFPVPVGSEFIYALAESEVGYLPRVCPAGQPI
jgi:endonuclease/exonuclease/phosphatase family metal-dependent hydrolase